MSLEVDSSGLHVEDAPVDSAAAVDVSTVLGKGAMLLTHVEVVSSANVDEASTLLDGWTGTVELLDSSVSEVGVDVAG